MKVLKFGAVWCTGCLVMKPRWVEIEADNPWLVTEYYDYDNSSAEVEKYKVDERLPTFIFLDKDGNELHRMSGEYSKEELVELINKYRDK